MPNAFSSRLTLEQIHTFTNGLSSYVSTGVPLDAALFEISTQNPNALGFVIEQVRKDIQQGMTFSEALYRQNEFFSETFIAFIQAGEIDGNLPSYFNKISHMVEREIKMTKSIEEMMFYPKVNLIVCLGLVYITYGLLIPFFIQLQGSQGEARRMLGGTSLFTKLIEGSLFLQEHQPLTTVVFLGIALLVYLFFSTSWGVDIFKSLFATIPSFQKMQTMQSITKFFQGLGTFVSVGIPVGQALKLSGNLAQDEDMKSIGLLVRKWIDQGENLSMAFKRLSYFEDSVIARIQNAETTGTFQKGFQDTAHYFEEKSNEALEDALGSVKRILKILVICVVVTQIASVSFIAIQFLKETI